MFNKKFTLCLDGSQVSTFLGCPQLWYNQYVRKLVIDTPRRADDPRDTGTYGHRILDLYYKLKANGVPFDSAIAIALGYDPDSDTCVCGCLVEEHHYLSPVNATECMNCGKCLHSGAVIQRKPFPLNQDMRFRVRERLKLYFAQYAYNDYIPHSPKHVEVGFSQVLYEDASNLFVIEGRIDLLGSLQGLNCIVDHKFQLARRDLYMKSIQFKTYALVAKSLMLIINYIRLAQKVEFDVTFNRTIVNFTVPELLYWKQELIKTFFIIKQSVESGVFERRWNACSGLYGHQCIYTPICEEFNDEMVEIREKQLYTIKEEEWKPW